MIRNTFFSVFLVIFAFAGQAFAGSGEDGQILRLTPLNPPERIRPGQEFTIHLRAELQQGWHINSDRPNSDYMIPSRLILDENDSYLLDSVSYPEPSEYDFDFADRPVSVFEDGFTVSAVLRAAPDIRPGARELPLKFEYQACRDDACLSPETVSAEIDLTVAGITLGPRESDRKADALSGRIPAGDGPDAGLSAKLEASGLLLSLFLVFAGGLALNLTPCVYPIIPITISYFGAQSEGRTSRLFFLGLLYVVGMSAAYSAIGVAASFTGAVFGAFLQHPATMIAIAAFFILLALGMFGFYELSLPQSWTETAGTARAGLAGALLMGLTVGIVAAPCIGPLVLGLMAYVAARSDPVLGFLLFFFLSLGLGTPYLFLALFSGKIKSLPRSGQWMDGVRHIFGLALAGAAVYFVSPLLPGPFGKAALPVFGIISAAYLLAVDRTANKVIFFRIFKTVLSVILIAVSAYALLPGDQAGPAIKQFSPRQYEKALDNRKKIVIFFHADWCIPCRELKNRTLSDPAVKKRLSRFEVFGVDLTRGTPPEAAGLEQEFGVRGVPTIVILDTEGRMANSIAGFVGPEEFLEDLGRVE